jgi:hypothetical protein
VQRFGTLNKTQIKQLTMRAAIYSSSIRWNRIVTSTAVEIFKNLPWMQASAA